MLHHEENVERYWMLSQLEMAEDEYNSAISAADKTKNEESSPTSSALSLHYSSPPFETHNSFSDSDKSLHRVQLHLHEPEGNGTCTNTRESSDNETGHEKLNNTEWCVFKPYNYPMDNLHVGV